MIIKRDTHLVPHSSSSSSSTQCTCIAQYALVVTWQCQQSQSVSPLDTGRECCNLKIRQRTKKTNLQRQKGTQPQMRHAIRRGEESCWWWWSRWWWLLVAKLLPFNFCTGNKKGKKQEAKTLCTLCTPHSPKKKQSFHLNCKLQEALSLAFKVWASFTHSCVGGFLSLALLWHPLVRQLRGCVVCRVKLS